MSFRMKDRRLKSHSQQYKKDRLGINGNTGGTGVNGGALEN